MSFTDQRQEILDSLKPLFEEADRRSMWFYSSYQSIWFTPNELRARHANNQFVWGAMNWVLRHPTDRLAELQGEIVRLQKELEDFKQRILRYTDPPEAL